MSSNHTQKEFLPERDFVGYGGETPPNCWPNGAKIALSFVLNYEEGAEHTLANGDTRSEGFLSEVHYHREPVENRRDLYVESLYEYGSRCGVPRILKLFKEYGWSMCLWVNGKALENTAAYAPVLVELGHEIACHGHRWFDQRELGPEMEELQVGQAIDTLQRMTGLASAPTGWYYSRGSTYNKYILAKVHKEKNVPLLYTSDIYADDVPYWVENPLTLDGEKDDGLLCIPYSLVNNDTRFHGLGAGFACGEDFFNLLKDDFDGLYEEGQAGHPKMMTIALHARVIGRPGRIASLRRFMDYVKSKPAVWVTTRERIAHHWRKEYPYSGPTRQMFSNGIHDAR